MWNFHENQFINSEDEHSDFIRFVNVQEIQLLVEEWPCIVFVKFFPI
jgi:hypothetical protein